MRSNSFCYFRPWHVFRAPTLLIL